MKKWVIAASAVAVLAGAAFFGIRNANLEVCATSNGTRPVFVPTITSSPADGKTVSLLSGRIHEVASKYKKYVTYKDIGSGDQYKQSEDLYMPDDVQVSWTSKENASYYTVRIGTDKKLTDAQEYVTFDKTLAISDLYSGEHYYYQVVATFDDKTVQSRIFDFETEALPRTVWIDGVSNTRDIGGCVTEDGKHRLRQGMVYRGAKMDGITQAGIQKALGTYGIKTDLDLRNSDEGMNISPLGADVNYVKVGAPYYIGDNGINNANYREALITEIKIFAKSENYPIYVHCSMGKDRTGTICFLIEALCGMKEMDIYRDYELSFLSVMGSCDSKGTPDVSVNIFTNLYKYIDNYRASGTLAEKTEKYMINELNITQAEINAIRSNMLEEVK